MPLGCNTKVESGVLNDVRYRDNEKNSGAGSSVRNRVVCALYLSTTITVMVVFSAFSSESRLGAPLYWTWLLTGMQVVALWAAGQGRWWAWLLGAAVQPPWIAYALLTDQLGFVPGCLASAAVQTWSMVRDIAPQPARAQPARVN